MNLDWDPRLVLDAGANVGLASRLFAALWPRARIISLEPDRANFAMLELNAAMAPSVEPQNVSIGCELTARAHMQALAGTCAQWHALCRDSLAILAGWALGQANVSRCPRVAQPHWRLGKSVLAAHISDVHVRGMRRRQGAGESLYMTCRACK